jgi:CRISPR-associated protein Csy1
MSHSDPQRAADLRRIIDGFLADRLGPKLEALKEPARPDTADTPEKREQYEKALAAYEEEKRKLRRDHERTVWIKEAAGKVAWIEMATHSIKHIHSGAKGTSIYRPPVELASHDLMGSQCLGSDFEVDVVVSNAAGLYVLPFLRLCFDGKILLDLMHLGDADLLAVLSDDDQEAVDLAKAFTGITKPREKPSSHTLSKQLYWLTGSNPRDDSSYQILSPLFPTSLTHRVYQIINADRFSEATKAAREARKTNQFTDHVLRDYPNMAVQKLGGTNTQNISQFNNKHRGENYLLASLPPKWKSSDLRPLLKIDSMYQVFERRAPVKEGIKSLLVFLKSDPTANAHTRARRDELVTELVSEMSVFRAEILTLPPGWSQLPDCRLKAAERWWLDPDGAAPAGEQLAPTSPSENIEEICQAFGRWLNRQMRDPLPMGDPEYLHWCALAQAELDAEEWEVVHAA